MPYRRLPKTDRARLSALKCVLDNDSIYTVQNKVISKKMLSAAETVYKRFEKVHTAYLSTLRMGNRDEKVYKERLRMARMFISHFIQVLHLAMQRGEIRTSYQSLYGFEETDFTVPDLGTERLVLQWGEQVIAGERERLKYNGVPVYNPNIAKVAVHYDLFKDMFNSRRHLLDLRAEALERVVALRPEVDEVLLEMWNEIELYFKDMPLAERVSNCRTYGVVYYHRRGETPLF